MKPADEATSINIESELPLIALQPEDKYACQVCGETLIDIPYWQGFCHMSEHIQDFRDTLKIVVCGCVGTVLFIAVRLLFFN